jgi:hypothetical protein
MTVPSVVTPCVDVDGVVSRGPRCRAKGPALEAARRTAGLQNASQTMARCQLERGHLRDAATPAADQDWNGHCFILRP